MTTTAADARIVNTYQKSLDPGNSYTICEHIEYSPKEFLLHSDGSTQTLDGTSNSSEEICATIEKPGLFELNDGDFEVGASSEAKLETASDGTFNSSKNAYMVNKDRVILQYAHELKRSNVKHQRDPSVSAETVYVGFRLGYDDDDITFDSFTGAPFAEVANAGSATIVSDRTNPYRNANTEARVENVGEITPYCQSIYYLSKYYTMRGKYWMLNGQVYANEPSMQESLSPITNPIPNGTIG